MREIRIDDEVYAALQSMAVPLDDDPNSVLRRVLDLDPAAGPVAGPPAASARTETWPGRAKRGELLSTRAYVLPLLETLIELGGAAPTADVLDALEPKLRLTDKDRELLRSGAVRWKNRAQFVRLRLVQSGDMAKSEYGIWAITDQGRARVRAEIGRGNG